MQKTVVGALAFGLAALSLIGCGQNEDKASTDQTGEAPAQDFAAQCRNSDLSKANDTDGVLKADFAPGVEVCRKACDGGDARSCFDMGWAYFDSMGVEKDDAAGVEAFRRACDYGDYTSCQLLGGWYAKGEHVEKDEKLGAEYLAKAVDMVRAACEAGDGEGCWRMGFYYKYGKGVEADKAQADAFFVRAAGLYRTACDSGDGDACSELGQQYTYGYGVETNLATALAYDIKSCDLDDARGCNNAAWLYATSSDESLLNGAEAVRLALRANELMPNVTGYLDTLAAAYARNGQFEEAIAAEEKAISFSSGREKASNQQRLELYRKGEAYTQEE